MLYLFLSRVRNCLSLSGANTGQIANHSIRKYGDSFCYPVGLSADSLKLLGHWRLSCYLSYIDNNVQIHFDITQKKQDNI